MKWKDTPLYYTCTSSVHMRFLVIDMNVQSLLILLLWKNTFLRSLSSSLNPCHHGVLWKVLSCGLIHNYLLQHSNMLQFPWCDAWCIPWWYNFARVLETADTMINGAKHRCSSQWKAIVQRCTCAHRQSDRSQYLCVWLEADRNCDEINTAISTKPIPTSSQMPWTFKRLKHCSSLHKVGVYSYLTKEVSLLRR